MNTRRGFSKIALIVGVLVVLAGGIGYWAWTQKEAEFPVTQQNTDTTSQVVTTQPSQTTTSSEDKTANWKTYTNTTYGYHIKYPSDWKVSAASVVSNGKDQEIWVTHQDGAGSVDKKIVILAGVDSDGNASHWSSASATSSAPIAGTTQTVYLSRKNSGCIEGPLSDNPCYSSFFIPIYHNGVWYELTANYDADAYTGTYGDIFSTFGFSSTP